MAFTHKQIMGIKVLVVDDDWASARAIGQLLEAVDCRVVVCTDPDSAIPIALESGVDLVSLDIKMPRLDGYDVLSLIRSYEHSRRAPSVPVIAITGNVTIEDKAQAIASGFAAHLGKPVSLVDIQAVLGNVTALRSDIYRARYSVDQGAIAGRLNDVLESASADASQAVAGLALAIEAQGADLLRQMLDSAYHRDFEGAADAAARLADAGEAIGGSHFAHLCRSFVEALGEDGSSFERHGVLARAELDRIIFTLRERVLP
jgi:CheY-like chemotaxis protein